MKNLKSINTRLVSENTPAGQKFSVFTNLPSEISSEEICDEMQLVVAGVESVLVPDTYSYFSLMCIAGDVSGVTIKNAKYPLEKATITSDYQFGVSNEVLSGQKAEVSLKKGVLLLIQVW